MFKLIIALAALVFLYQSAPKLPDLEYVACYYRAWEDRASSKELPADARRRCKATLKVRRAA